VMKHPERFPELYSLVIEKQREMRRLLFNGVDFSAISRVLDFGCGVGTDLIMLARNHPQIACTGFTISEKQAEVAAARLREMGLSERVVVSCADSASNSFPGTFDVAIGLEVVHHIENKAGLFANLSGHLAEGGQLLL